MPVEKETTIESFDRFKTVDSYKQNVGSLTDANMAMVPVPVQHLELTKADTNLANLTAEGKSYAAGLGMPSDTPATMIEFPKGSQTFVAPFSGYIALEYYKNSGSNYGDVYIAGKSSSRIGSIFSGYGATLFPMQKGVTMIFRASSPDGSFIALLVKAEGCKGEIE